MRARVFLFGNGLSIGFDPDLRSDLINQRVRERLGADADFLDDLHRYLDPDRATGGATGFEQLAGAADRLAETLGAVPVLSRLADEQDREAIRRAVIRLRSLYLRVVGTVLDDIDSRCRPGDSERWRTMDAFARRVLEEHRMASPVRIFTLNYDSLLLSSLLNARRRVYDGFRGPERTLNAELDPWDNPCLYSLHGSVSWVSLRGSLQRFNLEALRASGRLGLWSAGATDRGAPVVVLGDQKRRMVLHHPFSVFYRELDRCLSRAHYVVVAGYGFGDLPVNDVLARHLATNGEILVWRPHGGIRKRVVLEALDRSEIRDRQVRMVDVQLPALNGFEALPR